MTYSKAKNKLGKQTLAFSNRPLIASGGAIVGVKEGQGPLGSWFDMVLKEDTFGEKTWEKSESKMLKEAVQMAMARGGKEPKDIEAILTGDLLNQLMSSAFMARDMQIPFIGLYGACSTMAESLLMGSVLIDGGYCNHIVAGASSHYCTAERQFRMPLEHGNQRPPSAQWTATAAGAILLAAGKQDILEERPLVIDGSSSAPSTEKRVCVTHGTLGKIIDTGLKDSNQMGAAMAPAFVDTVLNHLEDTGRQLADYDLILSGDLGYVGKQIAVDLLADAGIPMKDLLNIYDDCGVMIYEKEQDTHSGGSGCGCSASVFTGYVYKQMKKGQLKRVLLISTGALLSTISPGQGESIPGIAHAVCVETC
ncbi:stage V sporulation protein AD [Aminipila butyrica]|uniref:Stage V sporulation protein AD n=1 Tax=Aminipila butyrica TaxID=433296 RepID=A0A858BXP0_9FIRM|nr:stage V sporulation protein AD [Aminipila butyrica]QIB69855.1 stage V sporulation protein AD [Aminipila butyrica]